MSRSQLSLEFVYSIGVALAIAIIIVIATGRQFEDLRAQKEVFLLRGLGQDVRRELFIAAEARDGYSRSFVMPHNLSGIQYSVLTANGTVVLLMGDYEEAVKVPSVNGALALGNNRLRKIGGVVYLN
ncbi:hypothetical protein HY640_03495 [Candidatus Woesearchaeota archaeon]|nr:hypothetical protein [Candidatus Woesearchaeota archaeon]